MATKWIHNISGSEKTYQGRPIVNNAFFPITSDLWAEYQADGELLIDLLIGDVVMSADGSTDYEGDGSEQIDFLKGLNTAPRDADGSELTRPKFNPSGWHFEPRAIKFKAGIYKSLHNRKPNGDDIGDAVQKFFDDTNTELVKGEQETDQEFQTRLDTDCVKTFVDWRANYDQEIIAAMFSVKDPPTSEAYAYCIIAPDIPEVYGGSVPYISGGIDLSYAADKCCTKIDGRCSKRLNNDPVYLTNKIRLQINHSVGVNVGLQVLFEHYKA